MSQVKTEQNKGSLSLGDFLKYDPDKTPTQQAEAVLNYILENINGNVGLIYAANNDQAQRLHVHREMKMELPAISGSGQARLFGEISKMINTDPKYADLQGRVQIFPVATSLHGGDNTVDNQVTRREMDRDLNVIGQAVSEGYQVFGVPDTNNSNRFAIGGGVSKHWIPDKFEALDGKSQDEYVQAELQKIQMNPSNHTERKWEPSIDYNSLPKTYPVYGTNQSADEFFQVTPAIQELEGIVKDEYKQGNISDEMAKRVLNRTEALAKEPTNDNLKKFKSMEGAVPSRISTTMSKISGFFTKIIGKVIKNKGLESRGQEKIDTSNKTNSFRDRLKAAQASVAKAADNVINADKNIRMGH